MKQHVALYVMRAPDDEAPWWRGECTQCEFRIWYASSRDAIERQFSWHRLVKHEGGKPA